MCRTESVTFRCGCTVKRTVDCELAEYFNPTFPRTACEKFTDGGHRHDNLQCGKKTGFYCARKTDGIVFDKCIAAAKKTFPLLNAKKEECVLNRRELPDIEKNAATLQIFGEDIKSFGPWCEWDARRQRLAAECGIINNEFGYLNNLLNHAWRNRDKFAPEVNRQTKLESGPYDFSHSIFNKHELVPLFTHTFGEDPVAKGAGLIPVITDHSWYQQPVTRGTRGTVGPDQHGRVSKKPPNEIDIATDSSVASTQKAAPIRGAWPRVAKTPEGKPDTMREIASSTMQQPADPSEVEDRLAMGMRLRNEGLAKSRKAVAESMAQLGYDVEKYGVKPPPKEGRRRPALPKPTPRDKSDSGLPGGKASISTPANVRRSARTRNNKPKYVESPEDSDDNLGAQAPSTDKSDTACDVSRASSDPAWVDTPSRSMVSSSPLGPLKIGRERSTQPSGSPNSSPTPGQTSLSNRILEYQRCARTVTTPSPTQSQTAATSFDKPPQFKTNTPSMGLPANSPSEESQSKAALVQRSNEMAQQVGRDLEYQQQLAGITDGSDSRATTFQYPAPPGMSNASTMMPSSIQTVTSRPAPPLFNDQRHFTLGGSAANLFHQNLQQSQAASNGQPIGFQGHRSFSTGSVPFSGISSQPSGYGAMSTSESGDGQYSRPGANYEEMRRSFSSAADFTPQSLNGVQDNLVNIEPTKRDAPSPNPTAMASKRARLSLPDNAGARRLTPSTSNLRLNTQVPSTAARSSHAAFVIPNEDFSSQTSSYSTGTTTHTPPHIIPFQAGPEAFANLQPNYQPDQNSMPGPYGLAVNQAFPCQLQSVQSYDSHTVHPSALQPAEPNYADVGGLSAQQAGFQSLQQSDPAIESSNNLLMAEDPFSEPDWSLLNVDMFN